MLSTAGYLVGLGDIDAMDDLIIDFPLPTVSEMLDVTKSLNKTKSKIYFAGLEVDYGFVFEDACTQKQILELEKSLGYELPSDYKQFLTCTNGLEFVSGHTTSRIFSFEELCNVRGVYDWRIKEFLTIGTYAESSLDILIDLTQRGSRNMYVVDTMADECFSRLNCDFRTFLDRFISTNGDTFWEWGAEKTNIKQSVFD